ncbi:MULTISPECIES: LamG-like jellyroll fold domain-containing protein [unclassified Nocardioides]|uniref:LamG-like jellyroll fold domain-containing protein n=1 Tax=unclassified Nocardioides TaxID=2615069 RepID=UPI003014DA48
MTSRHPGRHAWRRIAAVALGAAVAGSMLASPGQAAPAPAPAAAAAADPVTVPAADILDVDFAGGKAVDHSPKARTATTRNTVGYPTDSTLGKQVMKVASTGTTTATNSGLVFDITDAWYQSPNVKTAATFECLLRMDGSAIPTTPEQDFCSGKQTGGFGIYASAGKLGIMGYIGSGYVTVETSGVAAGTWLDVVGVYTGTELQLYVNGVLAASKPTSGAVKVPVFTGSKGYWALGADANAAGLAELGAIGSIAGARIWGSALSAEQVTALAESRGLLGGAPAPQEYDELSADVLDVDFADGTPTDRAQNLEATTWGTPAVTDDPVLRRKVASFDGVDDAFSYPFSAQWSKLTAGVTVECVFRHDGVLSGEHDLCSNLQTGGYSIMTSDAKAQFLAYVGGAYVTLSAPVQNGVWYHAVGVYNGQEVKLYLNGELVSRASVSGAIGLPGSTARNWVIGGDSASSNGIEKLAPATIARSRVYSKPASATLVQALSAATFAGASTNVELTSSVPAADAHLTSAVRFQPNFTHPGNARGWTYTLDGAAVVPGQKIGAGLGAGAHEIVITATDVLGARRTWRIPFTSADIPTTGDSGTEQGSGKVTLSTTATRPGGGDVTTTYYVATPTVAEGGIQGSVPVLPSALSFTYTDGGTVAGSMLPDGETAASPASEAIPFQRFDVPATQTRGQELLWKGDVDPARSVSLRAWNVATEAWVELDTSRGAADAHTSLAGAFTADFVDAGVVHVLVTGADPFSDDLSPRDATAAADEDHFADRDAYDFSMAHFTDTQYLTEGAAGGTYDDFDGVAEASDVEHEAERLVWEQAWSKSVQWIRDNAADRKIAYTAHTGDVIENDYYDPLLKNSSGGLVRPGLDEQVDREFAFTTEAYRGLDAAMPNQLIAGNHDNQLGQETGPTSRFSKAFTTERSYDAAAQWPAGQDASYHAWDETTDADGRTTVRGQDSQNNYVLFSAGGLDFVAVGLSYGVTAAEAEWASGVFARYPDRNGILLTHAYLTPSSAPDGRGGGFSADGSRLYNTVVAGNPNVFLVLAGHEHGVATNVKTNVGPIVDQQHHVVELLADYQFYTVTARELFNQERCPTCVRTGTGIDVNGDGTVDHANSKELQFGASFLRLLQFDVDRSEMIVDTYSPFLENFGAREYDGRGRYNGAEDNLVLPVDLSSRTTSFATDSLVLLTPTDQVIGASTAASGARSSVRWNRLVPGQVYAWTASTSADPFSGEFTGTFVATADGVDTAPPVLTVPATSTVPQGGPFDALDGVSALDAVDGDLLSRVVVNGDVDLDVPGEYVLTYGVADDNGNQAAATRTLTVTPAPELLPTTVASSDVRVTVGDEATLTATVSPATATGTVQFLTGEEVWCEAELVDGTATCTTATLVGQGTFEVRATYLGNAEYAGSHATTYLVVGERLPVSFTGTVSAGGAPVPGACVYLYAGRDAPAASFASCSQDDGSFVVDGVLAGDYTVAVVDPSGRYATWWSPAPVTVDEESGPSAITLTVPAAGAVTGAVGDASGPLAGVCAFAYPADRSDAAAYASCTSADGGYGLYGVDAGEYDVAFFDPSGAHPTQWFTGAEGGAGSQSGAAAVAVAAGAVVRDVDAVLTDPAVGVVRGTVTDAAGPVAGACVYLYADAAGPASYATCTDADGGYWLPVAEPGSYRLAVADPADAHLTQWWTGSTGGAADFGGAVVLSGLTGGATVTADAVLAVPVRGGVAGRVSDAAGGVEGACVFLYAPGTTTSASYATCSVADGTYQVPAGAGGYQVAFFDPAARYATQWWTGVAGGAPAQAEAVQVDVAQVVRTGIDAVLAPVA